MVTNINKKESLSSDDHQYQQNIKPLLNLSFLLILVTITA
jgi:hypothetical protein